MFEIEVSIEQVNVIELAIETTPNESTSAVQSVNEKTGAVVLDAGDIEETTTRFWLTDVLKTAYNGAVNWISTNGTALLNHLSNNLNPHNTTAAQVGAQETLLSGINIKTINGSSVLGSGDLSVLGTQSVKAVYVTTNGSSHTGDTTITALASAQISANEFLAGDIMVVDATFIKTGTAGGYGGYIYANTVNSLSGSPILLGQLAGVAANRWIALTRDISCKTTTTQRIFPLVTSAPNDYSVVSNASVITAINLAASWYIIFAGNVNSIGDTVELDKAKLIRVRQ